MRTERAPRDHVRRAAHPATIARVDSRQPKYIQSRTNVFATESARCERIAKPGEPAAFRTGGVLYGTDTFVRLAEGWRIQTKGAQPVLAAAETEKS